MKFGATPVAEAEGTILAHSLHLTSGKIAKGTVLGPDHIFALTQDGLTEITAARLEADDLHEDAAAMELAQAILPDPEVAGLRISGAGAGRVNLYATGPGIIRVSPDVVQKINAVDPMISIATVPDYHRVDDAGMVATIKIIAYGVPRVALQLAAKSAAGAIRRVPPVFASATLVETRVTPDTPPDKGRAAMAGRLARFEMELTHRQVVAHEIDDLTPAIAAASGDVILILTGSATSDPQDVAPEALRRAGGTVTRFGMPVDPGNLLFLGRLGRKPVIGLPGCARSPALNGADWVLERVLCGLEVTSGDIAAMGVGGLLKEIPTRPHPRREPET